MFSDRELFQRDFELFATVRHYSGCWRAYTPTAPVPDIFSEETKMRRNNPWVDEFLRQTTTERLAVATIDHAEGSANPGLTGVFNIWASFHPSWELESHYPLSWAVVACTDGLPAVSQHKYNDLRIGSGLLRGYKLKPYRASYNLIFTTQVPAQGGQDFVEEMFFKEPTGTIIAAHLYQLKPSLLQEAIDLSDITPAWSSVLIHTLPSKQ